MSAEQVATPVCNGFNGAGETSTRATDLLALHPTEAKMMAPGDVHDHLQEGGAPIPPPAFQHGQEPRYSYLNYPYQQQPHHYGGMRYYHVPLAAATTGGAMPSVGGYPATMSSWGAAAAPLPSDAERKRKLRLEKNRMSVSAYRQKRRQDEAGLRAYEERLRGECARLPLRLGQLAEEKAALVAVLEALQAEGRRLRERIAAVQEEPREKSGTATETS